jgi:hypothetical protein
VADSRKGKRESASDRQLLEELKGAVERLGIRVREEKLLREVGYRVRGGFCRLRGDDVIFLDRSLPVGTHIDVLVDELARRTVDAIYLSPAARRLVERAASRVMPSDASQAAEPG